MSDRILIVEDDIHISRLTSHYLKKHGYDTTVIHDGLEAITKTQSHIYDLILLDLMLPGADGWAVCQSVRTHSTTPIIMLTAKGEIHDRVQGLSLGADDYLIKPFDPQELLARMQAVLRRSERQAIRNEPANQQIRMGTLSIDPLAYRVVLESNRIDMPRREFDLLLFLVRHPNQVFTRSDLIERIWGWDFEGEDRVVDLYIKRIRQRLLGDHQNTWQITTIRGVGYKFEVNYP